MKKMLMFVAMALMLVVGVTASDMTIEPDYTHIDMTETLDVEVCVERASGEPYVGLDLVINSACQDLNGDEACGPDELGNADGVFSADVIASPTDDDGCGAVRLTTNNATGGTFVYEVTGLNAQVKVTQETGVAYVPEFGVLGAGLVLAIAGIFIARKRKD